MRLKRDAFDHTVDTICLVALIGTGYLCIQSYADLPDQIPTHYNFSGEVDGFGHKQNVWALYAVAIFLCVGLIGVSLIPHKFNYIVEITAENAERQYRTATRMIKGVNLISTGFFCLLIFRMLGFGNNLDLGNYTLPIFILLLFGVILFFISRSISRS
ncbi:MAG: DUF1648 domain-containing protein [Cyclobacteriaceae bacterium]